MSDNDQLHRFIIENTDVRGEIVRLKATWQAILERADYPESIRRVLGEAMAACALLSATIKYQGSLILQIRGDGPLHLLVAQCTSDGTLRGIARWHDDVPDHGLKSIFGNGQMVMTIEPDKGEPYQGIIALQGEHLKDAIETYFQQSEQLNTNLWLSADDNSCAGFLLQQLPNETPGDDPDSWNRTTHLAATLSDDEIQQLPVRELLHRLFHEDDVRLFESEPMSFRCNCSRERIDSMLISLGSKEVNSIIEEKGKIEVDCEFCNAHYVLDKIDVEALFAASNQPEVPNTKH
ncbi:MAG: Hsp33 family molecular chaperone HslO [Gammaproteobacteria bacterium]|nr:Hsp33 family molecular chaperone HslO [Gammaproteobacteria bacterium]